jgi:hypothetical protein
MFMKMMMKMKREERRSWRKVVFKCWWFNFRYNRPTDPMVSFLKKENWMVKIKKNSNVYGGPFIVLVHLIYLGLKLTEGPLWLTET